MIQSIRYFFLAVFIGIFSILANASDVLTEEDARISTQTIRKIVPKELIDQQINNLSVSINGEDFEITHGYVASNLLEALEGGGAHIFYGSWREWDKSWQFFFQDAPTEVEDPTPENPYRKILVGGMPGVIDLTIKKK